LNDTHTVWNGFQKNAILMGKSKKLLSTETQLGATWNGRVAGGARWRVRLWRLSAAVHTLYIHTHTNTYNTHRYICVQTARTLTMCYPRPPSGGAAPNTHRFYWAVLCCVGSSRCYWLQKRGGEGGRKGEESDEIENKILVLLLLLLRVGGGLRSARELDRMTLSPLCVCTRVGESLWIR
jgi:hypothetical protein